MIRVALVDDQALIRSALTSLIANEPDLTIVGQASTGLEGVDLARRERPDVMLMDIRMPQLDGIEATRQICGDPELAEVRILVLTTFEEDENVVQALRAGASGFVGKGSDSAEILGAIRVVHNGDTLLSAQATRALINRFISPSPPRPDTVPSRLSQLTGREIDVMTLAAQGLSNSQIAERLTMSPSTAKTHLNRAMKKLGAHDRAQLVVIAYETGLSYRSSTSFL